MSEACRDVGELCRMLGLDPEMGDVARAADAQWPLLAPRPFLARIRPGDPSDPLLLQIMPQAAEMASVPGFSTDPLWETRARCGPALLRKYQGRVLMVAAGRCAAHCRFCFRRHFSFDSQSREAIEASNAGAAVVLPPRTNGTGSSTTAPTDFPPSCIRGALEIESTLRTIASDPSIHEIILSGGDPLTLSDRQLGEMAERLAEIPHLRRLRIHSRLPVMIPRRATGGLIRSIRGVRLSTIMVVHVNHPAEIDEEVARAFGRLIDAGVPLLSQSVLLRGVNDRADALAELFERLVDLRVIPYYLHQLDPVAGAAHFEVPESVGKRLIAELRARLPGYAVPRYVRETPGGACKEVLE
ncbi:MAG: EF-P beta-lysylation protein EpmB [Pirellulales bacterium]|nr:EF-P beta-lysylation protein EpmB [Pirellulales bacterium]